MEYRDLDLEKDNIVVTDENNEVVAVVSQERKIIKAIEKDGYSVHIVPNTHLFLSGFDTGVLTPFTTRTWKFS